MKLEIQTVEDVQPEGTNNYFVVVGGNTGFPWEQKGFATREAAEIAKELMERVLAPSQESEARMRKALLDAVKLFYAFEEPAHEFNRSAQEALCFPPHGGLSKLEPVAEVVSKNDKKRSRFTGQALKCLTELDDRCLEILKSIPPVSGASRLRHHIFSIQMQIQDSRRGIQDEYEAPQP